MNQQLTTALLIGGGLLAYNAMAKGTALKTMNFYPKSVDSIRFDGVTPVIRLGLAVQNTSGQQLIVRSIAGNLWANDYLIGNLSNYTPLVIRPNSESILFLTIRLSILGVVQDIINAFTNRGTTQVINLQARANVDNYQIPIDIKYKVG